MKKHRPEPRWLTLLIAKMDGTPIPKTWHPRPAKNLHMKKTLTLLALLTALSTPAQNLILNGDFEMDMNLDAGTYTDDPGAGTWAGWGNVTGVIDVIRGPFSFSASQYHKETVPPGYTGWPHFPENTTHFVDLAGSSGGSISQTFTTTPAADYLVSFRYACNPAITEAECAQVIATVTSSTGATLESSTVWGVRNWRWSTATETNAPTFIEPIVNEWRTNSFSFTATTAETTLTLSTCESDSNSAGLVDDVSVTLVP